MFFRKENKGITLIALVITIIVLLILAGITIATLTGDNGIVIKANEAKEQTEIGKEKEILKLAMTNMKFEKEEDILLRKEKFKEYIDNLDKNNSEVYIYGLGYIVKFKSSQRVYSIDEDKNIRIEENIKFDIDNTPGDFDGKGSYSDPYVIMSIEDLCYFSSQVNNGTDYSGKYIILGKTLDFKSELSYAQFDKKYKYDLNKNSYILDENSNDRLINLMLNNQGFIPIGTDANHGFKGSFEGNNNSIKNIYINTNGVAGLFGYITGGNNYIKNLKISSGNITSNANYAGGIIAINPGGANMIIENCENGANITGNKSVGGIMACNYKNMWITINNCKNSGDIISKCENIGEYNSDGSAAGIIGSNNGNSITINKCESSGNIRGKSAAGIIGGGTVTIINCKISANIYGEKYAGGAYAYTWINSANIYNTIITKEAVIISEKYAGGIYGIATNYGMAKIYNSCVLGKIKAPKVAGIAITVDNWKNFGGTIKNCYFAGTLEGNEISGLLSNMQDSIIIENSFYINTISSAVYNKEDSQIIGVESKKSEQIKQEIFIENLNEYVSKYNEDSENKIKLLNWKFSNNEEYPVLDE